MTTTLRRLVACSACGLQYDASDLSVGDRFHCGCGELVKIEAVKAHEAAVVRCSSCGAPRQGRAENCAFCNSAFTLHERDLHTICPGCTARISDRASYCHACGTSISPQATAGSPTEFACPACGSDHNLLSRRLGARDLTILECGRCAGIWLGKEVFGQLASDAEAVRSAVEALGAGDEPDRSTKIRPIADEPQLYRPCTTCGALMHRRNYGRKSGVIIDTCRSHGVWFDRGELDQILTWLKKGGAQKATIEVALERRESERHQSLYGTKAEPAEWESSRPPLAALIGRVVDFLGHFV